MEDRSTGDIILGSAGVAAPLWFQYLDTFLQVSLTTASLILVIWTLVNRIQASRGRRRKTDLFLVEDESEDTPSGV